MLKWWLRQPVPGMMLAKTDIDMLDSAMGPVWGLMQRRGKAIKVALIALVTIVLMAAKWIVQFSPTAVLMTGVVYSLSFFVIGAGIAVLWAWSMARTAIAQRLLGEHRSLFDSYMVSTQFRLPWRREILLGLVVPPFTAILISSGWVVGDVIDDRGVTVGNIPFSRKLHAFDQVRFITFWQPAAPGMMPHLEVDFADGSTWKLFPDKYQPIYMPTVAQELSVRSGVAVVVR